MIRLLRTPFVALALFAGGMLLSMSPSHAQEPWAEDITAAVFTRVPGAVSGSILFYGSAAKNLFVNAAQGKVGVYLLDEFGYAGSGTALILEQVACVHFERRSEGFAYVCAISLDPLDSGRVGIATRGLISEILAWDTAPESLLEREIMAFDGASALRLGGMGDGTLSLVSEDSTPDRSMKASGANSSVGAARALFESLKIPTVKVKDGFGSVVGEGRVGQSLACVHRGGYYECTLDFAQRSIGRLFRN